MTLRMVLTIAGALLVSGGPALAQANLRPDPTPRVPVPTAEITLEDRQFLETAFALSRGQAEIAGIARSKAQDQQITSLVQQLGDAHQRLQAELKRLAEARRVDLAKADPFVPDEGGPGGAASAVTAPAHAPGGDILQATKRLADAPPQNFGQAYVETQLDLYDRLVDLYQTEAGNTPDRDLATFAITTLVDLQRQREDLRRLAAQYGVAVRREGQPWMYGKERVQ